MFARTLEQRKVPDAKKMNHQPVPPSCKRRRRTGEEGAKGTDKCEYRLTDGCRAAYAGGFLSARTAGMGKQGAGLPASTGAGSGFDRSGCQQSCSGRDATFVH